MDIGIILLFDGQPGNTLQDCAAAAKRLEDMGFSALWLPDHVVLFEQYEPEYPFSADGQPPFAQRQGWYDPLFGLLAAASTTSRIRLGTNILIVTERNPVLLAKDVVAVDHFSGGRVELGLGVGWCKREFDALGIPFERRGRRADEYIEAMTRLWQDELATYEGEFVSFSDAVALPKPIQKPRPPILVGGQSRMALKRAARLGDGWINMQLPVDELHVATKQLDAECEAIGRDPASLRRIHSFIYSTADIYKQYLEVAYEGGAELSIAPWVPDRDPQDVIEEVAQLGGLV
ncbi:MAG TPA: LLM class F420-dependent oxidoreductase [Mycobacterium sp.]|nr:LLM class F420-dependent oxidoreductase [Mycobacterium sp.]